MCPFLISLFLVLGLIEVMVGAIELSLMGLSSKQLLRLAMDVCGDI